jgi:hypothetical protein
MKGFRLRPAADKRTAGQAAGLALEVSTQVGGEWRAFQQLRFFGRLWWLISGQIGFVPWQRAKLRVMAIQQRRATRNGLAARREEAVS